MGLEVNVARPPYLGDQFVCLDCPGSVEFLQESFDALVGVDAAVIVCEAEPAKALALRPLFHYLETNDIPRVLFVNKIDKAPGTVSALVDALEAV